VSDLATPQEQRRLVTESRPTFVSVADAEHGVDESVPERICLISDHTEDRIWNRWRLRPESGLQSAPGVERTSG
jgi:hypothetical protein